ncbi:3364_t:CDS:1, partial [Scutellospora calospora]
MYRNLPTNRTPNDEKPTNENGRIKNSSSCNFCRLKKTKCIYTNNGLCQQCIKHNQVCKSDPQKKRGPKSSKKVTDSNTQSNANRDLQTVREAFFQFRNGNQQLLLDLIQEFMTNGNWVDNERTLTNLIINRNLDENPELNQ